jgi:hypothetical protein
MPKPTGRYLCSEETLLKVESYLKSLIAGTTKPGVRLAEVLFVAKIADFSTINAKQLIAFLMDTRKPKIFAEREPNLDGSDWNLQENAILGDIVFSTTGTRAFNNGAHVRQQDHRPPLDTHFLFIASALLRNDKGHKTSDMNDVLVNDALDEESFYKLYERRLLPGLLIQNEQAKNDGTPLVINIPGLGCGQFAGTYGTQIRAALPRVLKKLFETHGAKLDMVRTVNYDPYVKDEFTDEFTTDKIPNTQIRLMNRPLKGLPEGASGSVASQLEFPKDGTDYTNFRLIKIVAWDHFSFPGNDLWENQVDRGNGRATDDGVSFASSDVILALFNMEQFGSEAPAEIKYNSEQGIAYAINPENNQELGYEQLAKLYPSHVSVEMIDIVPTSGVALTQTPEEIQKKVSDFENKKREIQEQFIENLTKLERKINKSDQNSTPSKTEGARLHTTLLEKQEEFFKALTSNSTKKKLKDAIADFRKFCKENIEMADKIMGHGWLYRIVEVLIKAVVGLFAGIGMVLGSLVGQGLAKSEHRQKFANTFFTFNQTDESRALDKFKQEILGDEKEEPGCFQIQSLN